MYNYQKHEGSKYSGANFNSQVPGLYFLIQANNLLSPDNSLGPGQKMLIQTTNKK